jgi:hypothetical protein
MKSFILGAFAFLPVAVLAQRPGGLTEAAQREKLSALSAMDGTWRGPAWYLTPSGTRQEVTQTERIGPMLGGAVRVVEGRAYDAQGATLFNAFAVISVDPQSGNLTMRSYADGRVGDFPIQIHDDVITWRLVAGPATIEYKTTIRNGTWHEIGTRAIGNQPPVTFIEMTLTRLGDTGWPAGDAVKSR